VVTEPFVFLAGRTRRDGTRGWLSRRAWQVLVDAATHDDPDNAAFRAVLHLWITHPDDESWDVLRRNWRLPGMSPERFVLDSAVNPLLLARTRAAIGAFCARRGLVPDGAVDRAVFFLLTGQAPRHRAHDPDGSLLATAYQGMGDARRAVSRKAMLDAGGLDLVRAVVVDRPGRVRTGDEIDYLARQLAGAGEWAELWRLVRAAPVVPAVAAMPLFGDWRPAEADRAVFARLAAARPAEVAAAVEAVRAGRSAQLFCTPGGSGVSFAPDHSQLAIREFGVLLTVYDLPSGRRSTKNLRGRRLRSMLHAGKEVLAIEDLGSDLSPSRLVRFTGTRRTIVWSDEYSLDARKLVRFGASYVVAARDELVLDDNRRVRYDRLGLSGHWSWPFRIAGLPADAGHGRLAFGADDRHDLAMLDEDLRVVARCRASGCAPLDDLVFAGRDGLFTLADDGVVCRWRRVGDSLEKVATTDVDAPRSRRAWPRLCALPKVGLLAVVGRGEVVWLDGGTLAPAEPPRELAGEPVLGLWSDESHLAVARMDGQLDVYDLRLRDIADVDSPMAGMTVATLAALTAAARLDFPRGVSELFGLLRVCLRHRLATEIQLGTTPVLDGSDDIALGGRG
jgi:hypothetical protein